MSDQHLDNAIQVHIAAADIPAGDKPIIIFGFTSQAFSQAVYLSCPDNMQDAIQNAEMLRQGYIEAAQQALKITAPE